VIMAIKCLDDTIKEGLVDILKEMGASNKLISGVNDMPSCSNAIIEFESGKKEGKKERKRSAYQQFVSECMTGGKTTLKECAVQWNAMKR